ncbi:unnamed protein product, partial [Staurois parvus]
SPLASIPWLLTKHIPQELLLHPIIGPSLKTFRLTCKSASISNVPNPLTSLRLNPDFPPGMHKSFPSAHWPHSQVLANHFFHKGQLKSCSFLASTMVISPFPFGSIFKSDIFFSLLHIAIN